MTDHGWILDVFEDICEYAKQHNLSTLRMTVSNAKSVALAEIGAGRVKRQHEALLKVVSPNSRSTHSISSKFHSTPANQNERQTSCSAINRTRP